MSEPGFQTNKNGPTVKNGHFFPKDTSKEISINKNYLEFSMPYGNHSTTGLWARNLLEFLERSIKMELNTPTSEVRQK